MKAAPGAPLRQQILVPLPVTQQPRHNLAGTHPLSRSTLSLLTTCERSASTPPQYSAMVDTDKVHVTSITLQEWDDAQVDNVQGSRLPLRRFARRIRAQFNGALPPHRKYVGLSRSWLLCAIATAIVVVLALTIGLTVGLRKGVRWADSARCIPGA